MWVGLLKYIFLPSQRICEFYVKLCNLENDYSDYLLLNLYLIKLKPCWDSTSLLQKGSGQEGREIHDVVLQSNTITNTQQTINRTNNTEMPAQGKD